MSEQDNATTQDQVTSFLDLSDEEIAKLDPSQFEAQVVVPDVTEEVEASTEESDSSTTENAVDDDVVEEEDNTSNVDSSKEEETKEESTDEAEDKTKTPDVDYKAFYDRLTAEFKANGTTLKLSNPDDIISLMQMGANYNKKMNEFKEPRRYLKMLQENDLLSEDKIAFLIDLHKKDANAIAKLLHGTDLDMYDINSEEKANKYVPSTQAATTTAIELEDVLAELQDTPTYATLIDVVGNKFDQVSRERIATTPHALRDLNAHMANGTYDRIMSIVNQERALGRLLVPDIDAYVQVGNYLHSQGLLNPTQQTQKIDIPVKVEDPALKARRQAASAPKPVSNNQSKPSEINPLSMSDEEFAKHSNLRV